MIRIITLLFFTLSLSAFAQDRFITVKGEAEVEVKPDFILIDFAIGGEGQNVERIKTDVDSRTHKVIEAISKFSILSADTVFTGVQVTRNYDYDDDDNEIFKGYGVGREIQVRLRDIEKYESFAQALIEAGIDEVQSVEAGVDDESKLKLQALEAAAKNAHEKGKAISSGLGINLGIPIEVGEDKLWYGEGLLLRAAGSRLEEIVVTAQRRTAMQPLMFVPENIKVQGTVWVRFDINTPNNKLQPTAESGG